MSWMTLKRLGLILATFIFIFIVAITGILYFNRPMEMSSDAMDKQLLESVKETVSPVDIKSFIDMRDFKKSVVSLHLFTVCNETRNCSVYAFMGFAETGEGKPETTLFVEVETEAEGSRTSNFGNCEPLWRFKKSNWAIKILNDEGQGEALLAHGEFRDINRMIVFNGRSSAINILQSMQRAIVTRINEEHSISNERGLQCRVESTQLWETRKPDLNCSGQADGVAFGRSRCDA